MLHPGVAAGTVFHRVLQLVEEIQIQRLATGSDSFPDALKCISYPDFFLKEIISRSSVSQIPKTTGSRHNSQWIVGDINVCVPRFQRILFP